jgi:hypothetical protein
MITCLAALHGTVTGTGHNGYNIERGYLEVLMVFEELIHDVMAVKSSLIRIPPLMQILPPKVPSHTV